MEPNFWENPDAAQKQLQKVASIKSWITDYDGVAKQVEELEMMPEFMAEGLASEQDLDAIYSAVAESVEALELRNMLRGEEDKLGAILDINAGAGGTEALDWASMLLRMYTRWCEAHGYRVKMLDFQAGDEVGVKDKRNVQGYNGGHSNKENTLKRRVNCETSQRGAGAGNALSGNS